MRLVFVQHAGTQVCGSWTAGSVSSASFEEKALAAARQLDESMGKQGRRYEFTPFGPEDSSDGYDVFCCQGDEDDDGRAVDDDFSAVVCFCQYVGYVRRHLPG